MVRRWSHLNSINSCFFLYKSFKIEIFKSTLHFKKFYFKKTKFKRKKLSKWKHLSNWYPYLQIFKFWSLDYLFNKKISKYQFLINLFNFSYFIFNPLYLKKNYLAITANSYSFNSISLPKKIFFYLQKITFKSFFLNSNLIWAFGNKIESVNEIDHIKNLNFICESRYYQFSLNDHKNSEIYYSLINIFFQVILNKIICLYKILTFIIYLLLLKR